MKQQPLVSIIIPTLNAAKTLAQTLASIKRQTLPATQIEILIIDGGSQDRTLQIAQKYQTKIITNPDVLPELAKWRGLKIALGKYAVFLDSDEIILRPDSLEKKCLFLIYSLTLLPIFFYSWQKSWQYRKNYLWWFNTVISFYTSWMIIFYTSLKIIGVQVKIKNYGHHRDSLTLE